ncbi:hypothetical protein [Microbispora triticiradicis]|uniref:hypothetical protein n=1 Tax=Microbispora triticiradicis TaxID=2200763 RepID=UPI001AD6E15D|nr:hypothetical protein [Microbispora triticiradicis]MBO4272378.1 hypothetical protein [Microbispora triticiradicis]
MSLPTIIVEVQFTSGVWTDVSSWLQAPMSIRRGSTRVDSPVIRYEPGVATVRLKNSDRRFDPTHLSGPYVSGGVSQVTAMRPLRIRALWGINDVGLFRGYIDVWDIDWIATVHSVVTVTATDAFKILANKKRIAVDPPVGAGETTGARITRILDSAGWSGTDRDIATGNSIVQATDLSGDALSELQRVAESEIGELYVNGLGKVVFRNRHALLLDSRSANVVATFGQSVTSPAPFEVRLNTDDATLWNEVIAQRAGGAERTAGDSASQTKNTTRTYQKSDLLLESDVDVGNWAQWVLYISKDPEVRFDEIRIHVHADPANLALPAIGREIGDRIQIWRRPPGGGSPIVRDCFIRGVAHEVTQATWVTTWTLQSATRYISNFFLLNSGTLNSNIVSY